MSLSLNQDSYSAMTNHTACYRRGEMNRMTKLKHLYHRSTSISMQYLSKNTRIKSIYSLDSQQDCERGNNKLHYLYMHVQ